MNDFEINPQLLFLEQMNNSRPMTNMDLGFALFWGFIWICALTFAVHFCLHQELEKLSKEKEEFLRKNGL